MNREYTKSILIRGFYKASEKINFNLVENLGLRNF